METSEKPLVSVIIPCYNYENYLKDCIESILLQTYSNWECIIVDDGSTDNTEEVGKQLSNSDKRIQYFSQANSGPTIARNFGLSKAKGEFIQFIDADDVIEHKKFESQLMVFEKNQTADIVYSSVKYFRANDRTKLYDDITLEGSKPWMPNCSGKGDIMIEALLKGNIMVISSPLVRKSLFEKFGAMSEDLYFNEDWELWTRFAMGNAAFYFDNSSNTLALVRVHESYSKDNFKMYIYGLLACLKMKKNIKGWKFKRILIPKINYHKRIIDEKLIFLLKTDKEKAVERSLFIYGLTGSSRYSLYAILFRYFPVWFCYCYSRFVFLIRKLKNVIIYA
jgi:glycosyltransferase involved in cell wall biosynthesis